MCFLAKPAIKTEQSDWKFLFHLDKSSFPLSEEENVLLFDARPVCDICIQEYVENM